MSELNDFQTKFKTEELTLMETNFWLISLRPSQPTIGSLVVSLKRVCQSLSKLKPEEGADLVVAMQKIENRLNEKFPVDKLNYLALMMVDNQVHYHVIPRYKNGLVFNGIEYLDKSYPKPVDIFETQDVDITVLQKYMSS
jgi:diadenosine tetraphosphate (Ap4A) HIT family hydrolase